MSTTTAPPATTDEFTREAQALVMSDWECRDLARQNAQAAGVDMLTGAAVDRLIAMRDQHSAACEAFRRRHFPRAGRVVAVAGAVLVVSPTARRIKTVYDATHEGAGA